MKLLRILTGIHAGAQLRLARQRYVIGGDAQADIVLTDWRHDPVCLTVNDSDEVIVSTLPAPGTPASAAPDPDKDPGAAFLDELVPRRFGEIVICVGPTEAAWPSDLRLMESMVSGTAKPRKRTRRTRGDLGVGPRRPRRDKRMLVAAGVLCAAMLGSFVGVVSTKGAAGHAVAAEPLQTRVARAVQAANVSGVSVRVSADGSVSVEGMVFDGAEASRLRNALAPYIGERVAHRFASAADVSQSIGDALSNPGLAVRYRGDGEFVVTGASVGLDAVRAKLHRIATDLGQNVSRITLSASELPPPQTLPTNALMSTAEMQYVQTRDGTKHLVIRRPVEAIDVLHDHK
jgi:type III secretion protein D